MCRSRNHKRMSVQNLVILGQLCVKLSSGKGATGQFFNSCSGSCTKCVEGMQKPCINCTIVRKCDECPPKTLKNCYDAWIKRCSISKQRATKVLRMETSHVKYLLDKHKRLKLIQIFRDPRAIINSRSVTKWFTYESKSPSSDANVLCKRMENDIASAEQLRSIYPERVKIVQYEDFYDPNRTARILFDFLNLKMTDYVRTSVLGPLYSENPQAKAGFHPDSYRYTLDPEIILMSNKYCQKVFQSLGLRMFKTKTEIKNKTLNIFLDSIKYPLE